MGCNKNNKGKSQTIIPKVWPEQDSCFKPDVCHQKPQCKNNSNCCECCECCCHQDMREIYEYLGKYVYNILKELQLPCDHPSLICSLQKLADGKCLPCGHPSLEQLIMMAIIQDKPEKKCDNNHWCKYKN